jgi:two-component system chemotaxis response regulator CheB
MENKLKGIIRVLIVEDSSLMCKVLTNILNSDTQILVVGTAYSGREAVKIVPNLKPDLITMDMHMPVMDGLEATKQIMAYNPTPILLISTSDVKLETIKIFEAISYGALDVVEKGNSDAAEDIKFRNELVEKVKFYSSVEVIHHPLAKLEKPVKPLEMPKKAALGDKIIAIVASTGGPQALLVILKSFPKDFPCGIVVVQHITPGFVDGLAEWLDRECRIKVKIAQDSEEILPSVAYIAPSGFQTRVEERGRIHLSDEGPRDGHRPSGDILLESVARVYKRGAIGVILTGMGKDGALGIKVVKQMHGRTIAQDEKSSVIFGMPKAAIEMDAVDKVLSTENIAEEIVRML